MLNKVRENVFVIEAAVNSKNVLKLKYEYFNFQIRQVHIASLYDVIQYHFLTLNSIT